MAKTSSGSGRTAKGAYADHVELLQLMGPVVAFLSRSGATEDQLAKALKAALKRDKLSSNKTQVQRLGAYYNKGAVTDRWTKDPTYTNRAGKPLDLPFKGKSELCQLGQGGWRGRIASEAAGLNASIRKSHAYEEG